MTRDALKQFLKDSATLTRALLKDATSSSCRAHLRAQLKATEEVLRVLCTGKAR